MRSVMFAAGLAVLILTAVPSALRAEPIDLNAVVLDENDKPFDDGSQRPKLPDGRLDMAAPQIDLTVGRVLFLALLSYPDEPDEKFRRSDLAFTIKTSIAMTFSPEQTISLKKVVNRIWPAVIVYRVFPLLDPSLVKK